MTAADRTRARRALAAVAAIRAVVAGPGRPGVETGCPWEWKYDTAVALYDHTLRPLLVALGVPHDYFHPADSDEADARALVRWLAVPEARLRALFAAPPH